LKSLLACSDPLAVIELWRALYARNSTKPDIVTYIYVLKACAQLGPLYLAIGEDIHSHLSITDITSSKVMGSVLLNMYIKCGMPLRAVELWQSLDTQHQTSSPVVCTIILKACADTGESALEVGASVHNHIRASSFKTDIILENALLSMYLKCGQPQLVIAYMEELLAKKLLVPDSATYVISLTACANLGTKQALAFGAKLHAAIQTQGNLRIDINLKDALVKMYSKCGGSLEVVNLWEVSY